MHTTTKIFVLTLSLFLISNFAFSQESLEEYSKGAGIYETHEDYLNNKLTYYGEYTGTYHILKIFTVTFKDSNGKKTKIVVKKNNIWGYKTDDGFVYRIDRRRREPCKIMTYGAIVLYGDWSYEGYTIKEVTETTGSFKITRNRNVTFYQMSFGTDGEMYGMSVKMYKKELEKRNDEECLAILKEAKSKKRYSLRDLIAEYNKKHK